MNRDAKGRFTRGNEISSLGGKARARKLTARRRKAIARKARRAMVFKHFGGDDQAQREYWGDALGRWNYEQQAGLHDMPTLGGAIARATKHPGTISEFLSYRWQLPLFGGSENDVIFMGMRAYA